MSKKGLTFNKYATKFKQVLEAHKQDPDRTYSSVYEDYWLDETIERKQEIIKWVQQGKQEIYSAYENNYHDVNAFIAEVNKLLEDKLIMKSTATKGIKRYAKLCD